MDSRENEDKDRMIMRERGDVSRKDERERVGRG
jgi:hypothetical protein